MDKNIAEDKTIISQFTDEEVESQIRTIFNQNKVHDLKKFMKKRDCLNQTNQYLDYLFHIIQSAGVLTTTIAAGYDMKEFIWIGVGMNILASLIAIFEKSNDSISKRVFKDIYAIKNGTYVDEGIFVNVDVGENTSRIPTEIETSKNSKNSKNPKTLLNVPFINDINKKSHDNTSHLKV
jgi:hypothetical protein